MRIKIISLIKRQQELLKALEEDYLKRIRKSLSCEVIEIKREAIFKKQDQQKILQTELKKLRNYLKENGVFVVLDSKGKEYNSQELADWLKDRIREGERELVFVIGGPLGLSEELTKNARWCLSLSKLTFPHKLVRVLLLETLYRSLEIGKGGSYHK